MRDEDENKSGVDKIEFQLIPDVPLVNDTDAMFGHKQVVEALFKVIKQAKPYFTIGLYGSWGSGKSTIVNLLFNRLKKANIPYVLFDVWKYEQDSLRRQFLIESTKQLLNDQQKVNDLKKKFTYTVERKEEGGFKLNKKALVIKISLFAATSFMASWILALTIPQLNFSWQSIINSTLRLTIASTFIMMIHNLLEGKLFDQILVVDELSLTQDKLSQPEEFQEEFKNLLAKVNSEKVVFVLDNLDRVGYEKSVELLTTVKTFLEEDKCIFLIPCDEGAIRRHVANTYLSADKYTIEANSYADEFLRKFFNLIIRIPKSENLELDNYTSKLLKTTKIPELQKNRDLEWIITSAYRSNPREIKQFINSLVGTILLIKEKINSKDIVDKSILNDNVAFLAKMLIFKQKFPDTYIKLEDLVMNSGHTWEDLEALGDSMNEAEQDVFEDPAASKFISESKSIIPKGVELSFFLTLNQSADEKQVPGWSQFLVSSLNKELEPAEELFEGFIKNKKLESFDLVSSNYLKTNKSKVVRMQSFSTTYIKIYKSHQNVQTPKLVNAISLQLPTLIKQSYEDFPIEHVLGYWGGNYNSRVMRDITKAYIDLLEKSNGDVPEIGIQQSKDVFYYIAKNPSIFRHQTSRIQSLLRGLYNKQDYLDIFRESEEKDLLANDALTIFIDNFKQKVIAQPTPDLESLLNELNWLSSSNLLLPQQFASMVEILGVLFAKETTRRPQDVDKRIPLLSIYQNYMLQYLSKGWNLSELGISTNLDQIQNGLVDWYNEHTEPRYRQSVYLLAKTFWKTANNEMKTKLENEILRPYLTNTSYADGYNNFSEEEMREIVDVFPDEYTKASLESIETYLKGAKFLDKARKNNFYLELSDKSIDRTLQLVIEEKYIPEDIVSILTKYYPQVSTFSPENKNRLVKVSIMSKLGNNKDLKDEFVNLIHTLNGNTDDKEIVTNNLPELKKVLSKRELAIALNDGGAI